MKSNLILLHGALGSKEQFDDLKFILENHFHVHCLNFEGHDGVNTERYFSIDLFTDNLLQFIKSNKIEASDVFGFSMGGYVALKFASLYPGMINKIITLGTKLHWDQSTSEKEIKMLNPDVIEIKIPFFAETLRRRHQPTDWKIVVKKTAAMMAELGNGKGLTFSDFKKIKNSVLIALGSEDKMVTSEESEKVSKIIPNGKFIFIDGFQHPIETVDKKILAEIIVKFFEQ